jgi:adenine deaminase
VDPHEIANVSGLAGIRFFLEQADQTSLEMFIGIPSCVPATHLETAGATITPEDIRKLLDHPRVYGLAEMMNFPGIIHNLGNAREKVDMAFEKGKIVDGHCPAVTGSDLDTYISNGKNDGIVRIMSDHETLSYQEAVEKIEKGMYVGLRYGSASKDMNTLLPELIKNNVPLQNVMLCSDDLDPVELYQAGHVNRIIKHAQEIIHNHSNLNILESTMTALSLATINPGRYFERFFSLNNLPQMGELSVGKRANIVILDSLEDLCVKKVFVGGDLVAQDRKHLSPAPPWNHSAFSRDLQVGRKLVPGDFQINTGTKKESVSVKVIATIPSKIETRMETVSMTSSNGILDAQPDKDILKVAVIERHNKTGNMTTGFVRGLHLRQGAIASTIAHDSHNLIVAGVDDETMARAANHLIENGGGMVTVADSVTYLPLTIGGLMSHEPIESVVAQFNQMKESVKKMGSSLENTFMTMAFLALPVIPELRITDQGMVDVTQFKIVDLITE